MAQLWKFDAREGELVGKRVEEPDHLDAKGSPSC